MIVDLLSNWRNSFSGPIWTQAFDFLQSLPEDAEDGYTALSGDDMFARVMTYPTRGPDDGILESHRKYIDIQSSLVFEEGLDWFPRSSLEIKSPYNKETDVELYHRPDHVPARVDILPGMFVVLFPSDAHMAQQVVGDTSKTMKKVVVKVKLELLDAQQES